MAGVSNFWQRTTLRAWFLNTAFTPPATVYIGLFPADPGADGTSASEITGNAYTRQACTFNNVPSSGTCGAMTNQAVTWSAATGSWGTIAYIGLFDASTAGNFLGSVALTVSKLVGNGDTFRLPATNLSIAFS